MTKQLLIILLFFGISVSAIAHANQNLESESIFIKPEIDFSELDQLEAAVQTNPDLNLADQQSLFSDINIDLNSNVTVSSSKIKPFWIGCLFGVFGYLYTGYYGDYNKSEQWATLKGCFLNGVGCFAVAFIIAWS
jgi:hypothetical protein